MNRKTLLSLALLSVCLLLLVQPVFAASPDQDGPAQPAPISPRAPYAIGWGTLTLINAGIAQGKNRGGLNWFLISILLGPLATLILVAFFPKLPTRVP